MRRVAVSFAVAACWVLCSLAPAEAQDSLPENGKIAFTRHSGGIGGLPTLYTVEPNGSNLSRFTNSRYPAGQPSWSPDGTKVAFHGEGHVTVMDADGSNRRDVLAYQNRLGSGVTIDDLIWSPDGNKLAFISAKPPDYFHDIYMMDSDGSNLVKLTKTPGLDEMNPDFSPSGSQICFSRSSEGSESATGIYVMNADGSDPTLLSEDSGADELDWSPDGTEIVFHSTFGSVDGIQEDGDEEIYIINPDGSGRTALTSDSAVDVEPDWSPDGKKITFSSDRDPPVGNYDIYTMDADGSDVAKVTLKSLAFDTMPDWLPLPGTTPSKDADGPDVAKGTKKPGVNDVDRDRPERTVVVKPGDSLWSISEQRLGPQASPRRVYDHTLQMYALNRKIIGADPDLIFAGQRLSLPPLAEG